MHALAAIKMQAISTCTTITIQDTKKCLGHSKISTFLFKAKVQQTEPLKKELENLQPELAKAVAPPAIISASGRIKIRRGRRAKAEPQELAARQNAGRTTCRANAPRQHYLLRPDTLRPDTSGPNTTLADATWAITTSAGNYLSQHYLGPTLPSTAPPRPNTTWANTS